MKKLLKNEILKVKLEIKNRYLAGESVPSIAKGFDVVPRTIYFHLGALTPEEKGLHAKNSPLRKMAKKRKKGREVKRAEPKTKTKATPKESSQRQVGKETSLVDFIAG